jgi:hypothetical protein
MSRSEEDIIVHHILRSEDNVGYAFDVANAYPKARHRLIAKEMSALKQLLQDQLGPDVAFPEDGFGAAWIARYATFSVRVRSWPEDITVAIQADASDARQLFLGVTDAGASADPDLRRHLNTALSKLKSSGMENVWAWWYELDPPYRDWNTKDAMIRFHNGDAAKDFAGWIVKAARIVQAVLEERTTGETPGST